MWNCRASCKTLRLIVILLTAPSANWADETENTDLTQLVKNHTEFAFKTYDAINPSSNTVFSPYSLATCLEMLFIGARGDTADQMQKTLHLSFDRIQLPPLSAALAQKLQPKISKTTSCQLKVVNGMWLGQQFFILSDYSHTIESSFQGKISRLDFNQQLEAIQTINKWTFDQTQGKIADLVQANDLTVSTRLILTNALYFQGNWISIFDAKSTTDAIFYPTPDAQSSIKMMQQTSPFPYFENDLVQMIALPFSEAADTRLACVVLLPRSTENLAKIEMDLNTTWVSWICELKTENIAMKLPKFTLVKRFDLNQTLQQLGMQLPFTTQANLAGIDGKLDLYLSKVLHQVFFAVDENGVNAAASTTAAINTTAPPAANPPISFVANHPFLFFIADLNTQEIIFMGKFQEPKEVIAKLALDPNRSFAITSKDMR